MERYEMKKVIQFIKGMYPGWKPTAETIDSWSEFFSDYTVKDVKDAVMVHARTSPFTPSAAEILNVIQSRPTFELLSFNDRMYVIKIYIRNNQHEDTVFNFHYQTKEEANEDLKKLKEHHSYDDIEQMWIQKELAKSPPGSLFRKTYEQLREGGDVQ